MESLCSLIDEIERPWSDQLKSALFDFSTGSFDENMKEISSFGYVISVGDRQFDFMHATMNLYDGVRLVTPPMMIHATMCDTFDGPIQDMWIGFKNAKICHGTPMALHFDQYTSLWELPDFNKDMPLTFGHLFSGAICGWSRAMEWQFTNQVRHFVLDHDPEAIALWQTANGSKVFYDACGSPICQDLNFGILMNISDNWFGLRRNFHNLTLTLSPPCISWSHGGKGDGLKCVAGMAFWDGIQAVKWLRPVTALFEGVDATCSHSHFKVIREAAKAIGYKIVWSQVVRYEVVAMNRSRWLSVWVRNDVPTNFCVGIFKLVDVHRKSWDDETFNFFVPSQIKHQLLLSTRLLSIYGDPKYLPVGMRGGETTFTQQQVLQRRCVKPEQIMPTLTASYSNQHSIAKYHLENKGIYAPLMQSELGFQFIDPLRFVGLLGCTRKSVVMLPTKVVLSFHFLGNAIAIPHALLPIRIMMSVCGFDETPVAQIVTACWHQRIKPCNAVVLRNKDFVIVAPLQLAQETIATHCLVENANHEIQCCIHGVVKTITCPGTFTLFQLAALFGIEEPDTQGLLFRAGLKHPPFDAQIEHLVNTQLNLGSDAGCAIEFVLVRLQTSVPATIAISDGNVSNDDEIDEDELLRVVVQYESDEPRQVHTTPWLVVQAGTDICHTVYWPLDITDSQVSLRLSFMLNQPDSRRVIPWFQAHQGHDDMQPIAIADVHSQCDSDCVAVILINESKRVHSCQIIPARTSPINAVLGCFPNVVSVTVNQNRVDLVSPFLFKSGDVIQVSCAVHDPTSTTNLTIDDPSDLGDRLKLMQTMQSAMGSDELQFTIASLKMFAGNKIIAEPLVVSFETLPSVRKELACLTKKACELKSKAWIPIWYKKHWSCFEIEWFHLTKTLNINAINMDETIRTTLTHTIQSTCRNIGCDIRCVEHIIPAKHGWCGWAILFRCCMTFIGVKPELVEYHFQTIAKRASSAVGDPWFLAKARIHAASTLAISPCHEVSFHAGLNVQEFARCVRSTFATAIVAEIVRFDEVPFFGNTGTNDGQDTVMTPANPDKPDPWEKADPWKQNKRNARWEDLQLPEQHCFLNETGERLQQVHRHQLNAKVSGVAFCTKSMISEILSRTPKAPFALLLPANDRVKIDPSFGLQISLPVETIVHDKESATIYKRQVVIAQHSKDVVFKLPEAVYKATLTEHKELVLEIHANLIPADAFKALKEKPIETFKQEVLDQFTPQVASSLQLYGVRFIWNQAQKQQADAIQVICKTPLQHRQHLLERSGIGEIFVRDFLTLEEPPTDTTIIPKFWTISKHGKDEALRSSSSLTGFAGLTLVRRGIAVRGWCNHVQALRTVLMAGDDRFNDHNANIVPRKVLLSTGWPLSTSALDVTKAVQSACGQAPIPMRCSKSMGVNTWSLGFEKLPDKKSFAANFNGITYEILLSEPHNAKAARSKPSKPSKQTDNRPGSSAAANSEVNQRLTTLEGKMASVERRQDTIESKLDNGFGDLQDQLRRVLLAVQPPRSVSPGKTGLTPPPKQQRQNWRLPLSQQMPFGHRSFAFFAMMILCCNPSFCPLGPPLVGWYLVFAIFDGFLVIARSCNNFVMHQDSLRCQAVAFKFCLCSMTPPWESYYVGFFAYLLVQCFSGINAPHQYDLQSSYIAFSNASVPLVCIQSTFAKSYVSSSFCLNLVQAMTRNVQPQALFISAAILFDNDANRSRPDPEYSHQLCVVNGLPWPLVLPYRCFHFSFDATLGYPGEGPETWTFRSANLDALSSNPAVWNWQDDVFMFQETRLSASNFDANQFLAMKHGKTIFPGLLLKERKNKQGVFKTPNGGTAICVAPSIAQPFQAESDATSHWSDLWNSTRFCATWIQVAPKIRVLCATYYGFATYADSDIHSINTHFLEKIFEFFAQFGDIPIIFSADFQNEPCSYEPVAHACEFGGWVDPLVSTDELGEITRPITFSHTSNFVDPDSHFSSIDGILVNKVAAAALTSIEVMQHDAKQHASIKATFIWPRLKQIGHVLVKPAPLLLEGLSQKDGKIDESAIQTNAVASWNSLCEKNPDEYSDETLWKKINQCAVDTLLTSGAKFLRGPKTRAEPPVFEQKCVYPGQSQQGTALTMRSSKLSKLLSMVGEFRYRIVRPASTQEDARNTFRLQKRIWNSIRDLAVCEWWLNMTNPDDSHALILQKELQGIIAKTLAKEKYKRIQSWKSRMTQALKVRSAKDVFSWVRAKTTYRSPNIVKDSDGNILYSPQDAIREVNETWDEIYAANVIHENPQKILEFIWPFISDISSPASLPKLQGADLKKHISKRKTTAAGGLDGWRTPEVQSLPVFIFDLIASFFEQIEEGKRSLPSSLCTSKQVALPKPGPDCPITRFFLFLCLPTLGCATHNFRNGSNVWCLLRSLEALKDDVCPMFSMQFDFIWICLSPILILSLVPNLIRVSASTALFHPLPLHFWQDLGSQAVFSLCLGSYIAPSNVILLLCSGPHPLTPLHQMELYKAVRFLF